MTYAEPLSLGQFTLQRGCFHSQRLLTTVKYPEPDDLTKLCCKLSRPLGCTVESRNNGPASNGNPPITEAILESHRKLAGVNCTLIFVKQFEYLVEKLADVGRTRIAAGVIKGAAVNHVIQRLRRRSKTSHVRQLYRWRRAMYITTLQNLRLHP